MDFDDFAGWVFRITGASLILPTCVWLVATAYQRAIVRTVEALGLAEEWRRFWCEQVYHTAKGKAPNPWWGLLRRMIDREKENE